MALVRPRDHRQRRRQGPVPYLRIHRANNTLSGITVSNGLAENSNGGGLLFRGFVTLDSMVFTGNRATGIDAACRVARPSPRMRAVYWL